MVRRLLPLLLAACSGGQTLVLAPVIDSPAPGAAADPYPDLEEVELQLAFAGSADAQLSRIFARGDTLELPGVPLGESLVVHLIGRVRDAEVAYGRTCSFDLLPGDEPPAPHLYFARTVRWADGQPPAEPRRQAGLAFAAADGSAVLLGGARGEELLAGAERFDARRGAFAAVAELEPRRQASLAVFPDGSALVVGGRDAAGARLGLIERVDPLRPASLAVQRLEDERLALHGHASVTLSDGTIVIIGGRADAPVDSVFAVELSAQSGELQPPRQLDAHLAVARADHTATRLSDDVGAGVLVLGGVDAAGQPVTAAELFKPLGDTFAPGFAASLAVPRSRHAAVRLPDGSVLVLGGLDAAGEPVERLERFSLDAGLADAGALPAGAGRVDFSLTDLPDGRVLLAGGRARPGGPPLASAYIIRLDPVDGAVDLIETAPLGRPRAGHQAVRLCDGTVLVVGGVDDDAPAERYNPPALARR